MFKDEYFDEAFEYVVGHEGGYVNDPSDRGGETKYGITKKFYPELDIKNLTIEQAKKVYYENYWGTRSLRIGNIDDKAVAIELFDTAVNMGVGTAGKFLQKALNLMNRGGKKFADLDVDGFVGAQTLIALDKVDKKVLLKILNGLQFEKYLEIVKKDPTQERFFVGWMKRVSYA